MAQSTGSDGSPTSPPTTSPCGSPAPRHHARQCSNLDGSAPGCLSNRDRANTSDPATMWWRHELLHRATLRNHPERMAAYGKLRDDLEADFRQGADRTRPRGYSNRCFKAAEAAEREWLDAARDVPAAHVPCALPAGVAEVGRPGGARDVARKQHPSNSPSGTCADRVRFLTGAGIDLVIGRPGGATIWDVDGRELIDIHLNGGCTTWGIATRM